MIRALILVAAASVAGTAYATTWEPGTLDQALAKAKANDRWVLIDVFATWCGPCHEMDEKVYPREDVSKALAAGFVTLKRDGEQGEGLEIAKRHHVVGFPTLLVLDASGAEVDRLMGFVSAKDLTQTLQQFRAGKGTLAELEKRLAGAAGDEALLLDVGTRHAMRGDPRAVDELAQVVKGDPENKNKRAAAALLTLGKYYYLRGLKDYAGAEAPLRDLQKRFPQSDEAGQVGYNLGIALHGQKRDKEAREVLDRWLTDGLTATPRDASRYNSYAWLCFKNGFDRARGIEVAKQGLELDPKDHGLWDTLAELEAQAGDVAGAREAEKKALGLKPGDTYYEAQLRRFGGVK
jgi:tetratricopeptide (TPR) repeat protein